MTLDQTKPNDATLYSELDDYQRETRKYVNNLDATLANNTFIVTEITLDGDTLTVGDELSNVNLEHVEIQGDGPQTISVISDGNDGQIKQFIARDSDITIKQDKTSNTGGSFRLNSLAGEDLQLNTNDVIVFVNRGGDGGETSHGYWQELYRTLAV